MNDFRVIWWFIPVLEIFVLFSVLIEGNETDDCPHSIRDCRPECIVYDRPHCRMCDCKQAGKQGANGMRVEMIGHRYSSNHQSKNSNNQCLATLVCMLSCDDGYTLGPKGQDGCQTCECTKHKKSDEKGNYGMTFGGKAQGGHGGLDNSPFNQESGSDNSPFNRGMDLSKTPFSSSIAAMDNSMGGGMGETSGIGMGGMRNGLMSVPGMFLRGPSRSHQRTKCLRDDIICPSYCLVVDDYGCKTCPCGPANGMGVEMIGHRHSSNHQSTNSNNQCLATLVCMLSCDDGYKLGPKGQDGCQTCECTKHKKSNEKGNQKDKDSNNFTGGNKTGSEFSFGQGQGNSTGQGQGTGSGLSFNPLSPGGSMTMGSMGGGSSMGSMGGGGSTGSMGGGSSNGCSGPFCALMSKTGGKSIKGPFQMPSTDKNGGGHTEHCIGPSCSAPGNHDSAAASTIVTVPPSCPTTDLCVKSCKYIAKLGPKMTDGCPSCACQKQEVRTTISPKQKLCEEVVQCITSCKTGYILRSGKVGGCPVCRCNQPPTPAPTSVTGGSVLSCTEKIIQCMHLCRNGYHLQNSRGSDCPACKCLPPPTPAPRSGIYSVLKNCPETMHCMTTCENGYSLEGSSSGCPQCACNKVEIMTFKCQSALSCPRGCQLGYRCGSDGCPTCSCIQAREIGVAHTGTYIQASLTCNADFSCAKKCQYGYKTGQNGCPTCRCLQPLAVHHTLTIKERCPESYRCSEFCPHGFILKTVNGQDCPTCECAKLISEPTTVAPKIIILKPSVSETDCQGHNCLDNTKFRTSVSEVKCNGPDCREREQVSIGTATNQHSLENRCPVTFQCNAICEHGFSLKNVVGKECPVCECAKLHKVTSGVIPIKSEPSNVISTFHRPGIGFGANVLTQGQNVELPSVGSSHHTEVIHTSTAGSKNEKHCIGPACSAMNGFYSGIENRHVIQPNQCADILTCVVTCKRGYKLGSKGLDGCPTCQCLK